MARDTLLNYMIFNEESKIHTHGSNFQLGEVTSQMGKPISSYSRKLVNAPKRLYSNIKGASKHRQNSKMIYNYMLWSNIENLY